MIDEATIEARAGNGGNGLVTFLREALRPLGGPAGGNGGNGGSVTLVADASLNTLLKFRWRRHFIAKNGGNGARNKRHGANGESVDVTVPVGTEVWRIGDRAGEPEIFLGDLVHPGQRLEVAKGGRGGLGNAAFVTAVNREPLLAEAGEAGETVKLRLNLKILADVGLVGMPNAGKSSLLTAISAARPKIADYPFTTLEPVLGIVEHGIDAFAAVDIPGLIEGASDGIGLGHEFLKHMQRTRLLVHVVDGSEGEPGERIRAINQELDAFDPRLAQTPQIIAINKLDLEEVELLRDEIDEEVRQAVRRRHAGTFHLSRHPTRHRRPSRSRLLPPQPTSGNKTPPRTKQHKCRISKTAEIPSTTTTCPCSNRAWPTQRWWCVPPPTPTASSTTGQCAWHSVQTSTTGTHWCSTTSAWNG